MAAYHGVSEMSPREQAASLCADAGFRGGLIVHIGCGDGRLTAELGRQHAAVVHGLDQDPGRIDAARDYVGAAGLYGPVSVECWSQPQLPYVDSTVNLLVLETPGVVSPDEIQRVLVPRGVALVKQHGTWAKTVKPPRPGVDEWTHFRHDASGNPVAHDAVVGPPRHLQWTAEPRHTRSHEYTPSIQSVVSSGGRIFYIADQGSRVTLRQPAEWKLMARDAYNGVQLWEKPIGQWFPHLFGWTQAPLQLQHKLIALADRVYVPLGFHAPLSALDAATGETVRTYPDTEGVEEIICHQGILLLVAREVTEERRAVYREWERLVSQPESPVQLRDTRSPLVTRFRNTENRAARTILALEASSGQLLWKKAGEDCAGLRQLTLRACGERVYGETERGVQCWALKSGEPMWNASAGSLRGVSEEAVVCVSREKVSRLSPQDGQLRWSRPTSLADVRDVLLIGDSVWLGGAKPFDTGNAKYTGPNWGPYFAHQHDLDTGELLREITAENPQHHHRCYDSKGTDRYILGGRRGTEFLDLKTGDYLWHSWARGTCRYGVMPCNGLLYVPPHECGCYVTAKIMGFNALAPANHAGTPVADRIDRLEKGVAYEDVRLRGVRVPSTADWPTYRGDAQRSARARGAVPAPLTLKWQAALDGSITAPTAAGGLVFIARPDQHELVALDRRTGKAVWKFTAGGRIDSPPTIHQGAVLFGSRDGFVYGLRARDGALGWRFQAARQPRRIVASGQIESASPVHGSVLVQGETLSFLAGRSSYLDGGLDLFRLDPLSGQTLSRTVIYSPDPETGQQPAQYGPASMPGARSDILAGDDKHIYLRDLAFDKNGTQVADSEAHLFTLTDYLDDSGVHRSYWIFGTKASLATGCSGRDRLLLFGRLLAFDDRTVYGYGRATVHWSNEFEDGDYRVFARHRDADKPHWTRPLPVHARALLLADDVVFAAGAGAAPSRTPSRQEVSSTPLLVALSAADGHELARYPIPAAPVLDGLAAAGGELLLTLENGEVLCLASPGSREAAP